MARIVGISGSLRKGSYNTALLRAAAGLAPAGTQVDIASIAGIPLYDGDVESAQGLPAAVTALKDHLATSDGILLVTPEYNSSIPGVFKNAMDWLSRPSKDIPRVFGDKPVAIMGATPGRAGTRLAQTAWLPVLRALGTRAWSGSQLYVSEAGKVFDPEGKLVDAKVRELLSDFMARFSKFVEAR
ncbi:MAG: NAD(P)H-dependent oxidoreductase [Acidobacteria bacterium]|nr:NAD(P)H-dependent oxidoreductase [Acidobacteriota bacterium]